MKKGIAISIGVGFLLMCGIGRAHAQIEDTFYAANKQYEEGAFAEAVSQYAQILDEGYESGALYYNLGNAYYRLGEIGRALVYYERARRLIPHDEDLFANMTHMRSLLSEEQPEDERSWGQRVIALVRDAMPASGWFFAALGVYALCVLYAVWYIFVPQGRHPLAIAFGGIFLVIVVVFAGLKMYHEEHYRAAIVVADEVAVRYSPSYDGAIAFKVHEGIKAEVVEVSRDWTLVRLGKGRSGWVESGSVEVI